jgi:1-acyl-sn-glycerol-3-phosphate acyltransferase
VEFVAKRELAANPLVARVLRAAGVRFVERFDVGRGIEDTRELVDAARAGAALVFFAEGTFTRAPGLLPFHMGAFVTAARAAAPVVPLALGATRSILRAGRWRPHRAAVALLACEPRHAPGADWAGAVKLRDAVRAEILAHCGEPDLGRQRPWLPAAPHSTHDAGS